MVQVQIHQFEVTRYRTDSIGRRRSLTRDKSYYALETLPTYARRGGNAWADDFARLSKHEQNVIVWRMVTQASRAAARRAGRPDPIWVEHTVKPLPGGGYVKVEGSEVPLRPEYGGDGRTPENTRYEQPRVTDTPQLRLAVEKLKAKFAAMGIEIVYEDPAPEPDPITTPKRKAAVR